jgi:hypothetical protein
MTRYIACYDLKETRPDPHASYLTAAEANGWSPWLFASDKKWYRLPNTTLVGEFTNRDAAVASFKAIKSAAEKTLARTITVEKWIVADYTAATFASDETSTG